MRPRLVHLVGGLDGCALAVERVAGALIIDALRASATAAMLCAAGAREIRCVGSVDAALAQRERWPDALLYGERGAVPPPGFDYGNSPHAARHAAGRRVVFTTTNGTACLLAAKGAAQILMASTVNAAAAAAASASAEVVVIPAGKVHTPGQVCAEDWAAAAHVARLLGGVSGEGKRDYGNWCREIDRIGLADIFAQSAHAEALRRTGQGEDVAFCAQCDITGAVPHCAATTLDSATLVLDRPQGDR